MPKNFFLSRNGEEIKAISFFFLQNGEKELFVSCIAGDDLIRGVGVDLQGARLQYKEKFIEGVTNLICIADSIGKLSTRSSDIFKSDVIDEFLTSRTDSIKAASIVISLNLICGESQNYITDEIFEVKEAGFGNKSKKSKIMNPKWIGKDFSIKESRQDAKEVVKSKKYLRVGYWRLKSCSSDSDLDDKLIWVKPTWVFGQEKDEKRSSGFRTRVLSRYGSACCLCNCSIKELIDAAHIIPFCSKGSNHVENGLPLCNSHHTAFDRKLFLIDPLTTKIIPNSRYSLSQLQIRYENLAHLVNLPGKELLRWRWNSDKSEF